MCLQLFRGGYRGPNGLGIHSLISIGSIPTIPGEIWGVWVLVPSFGSIFGSFFDQFQALNDPNTDFHVFDFGNTVAVRDCVPRPA